MIKKNKLKKKEPEQPNPLKEYIFHAAGFLSFLIISGFFTYYLNGSDGITLMLTLLVALLISVVHIIVTGKSIEAEFYANDASVSVGDEINTVLKISKTIPLPTPFIEVGFSQSDSMQPTEFSKIRLSLFQSSSQETAVPFKVMYSGKTSLEVDYIRVFDYLGLFHRTVYNRRKKPNPKYKTEIKVLPFLPDSPRDNPLADNVILSTYAAQGDEEDAIEANTVGKYTAGYENRLFRQGDPIKRINHKLSARMGKLYVRLDEKPIATGQTIIFDLSDPYDKKKPLTQQDYNNRELLITAGISLMGTFIRQGCCCTAYIYTDFWQSVNIERPEDITVLREFLSGAKKFYKFNLPLEELKYKNTSLIIFSQNANIHSAVSKDNMNQTHTIFYIYPESMENCKFENCWKVNSLMEFKPL